MNLITKLKKIFLFILILSLFSFQKLSAADKYIGNGELKLSYNVIQTFKQYVRNNNKKPSGFFVTTDGSGSYYIYCPFGQCQPLKKQIHTDECERFYKGKECKIFAMRRTVKWKNGINTGSAKQSKFKHNLSDQEFDAKLKELGFTGEITKKKSKITKKEHNNEFIKQIQDLKKLLDDKIITQEEFEKAKKKILE